MKRFLAPILLLTLLFPALALGEGVICKTTGWNCPESADFKDLIKRDGLYFKKRTDVPFTGKVTGDRQGAYRNGKRVGPWVFFHDNGRLLQKGTYKDGVKVK